MSDAVEAARRLTKPGCIVEVSVEQTAVLVTLLAQLADECDQAHAMAAEVRAAQREVFDLCEGLAKDAAKGWYNGTVSHACGRVAAAIAKAREEWERDR